MPNSIEVEGKRNLSCFFEIGRSASPPLPPPNLSWRLLEKTGAERDTLPQKGTATRQCADEALTERRLLLSWMRHHLNASQDNKQRGLSDSHATAETSKGPRGPDGATLRQADAAAARWRNSLQSTRGPPFCAVRLLGAGKEERVSHEEGGLVGLLTLGLLDQVFGTVAFLGGDVALAGCTALALMKSMVWIFFLCFLCGGGSSYCDARGVETGLPVTSTA